MNTNAIISEHIFIFPFSFRDNKKAKKNIYVGMDFEKNKFNNLSNWTINYSNINDDKDYNEFVYFYKPIRVALYTIYNQSNVVKNYTYKHISKQQGQTVNITVKAKEYKLSIKDIRLRLYKTGIGMLTFELVNKEYTTIEALEAINSFSKMIYPPTMPLKKAQREGFPEKISIWLNKKDCIMELFDTDYYKEPLMISKLIMDVLGPNFSDNNRLGKYRDIIIEPILGNQMFCCCVCQNSECNQYGLDEDIDKDKLETFMTINKYRSYIGESSYIKNEYSVYGINRYMLLCLTREWKEARLYNQLVTLVLMQRATLLNLSTEIARISTLPKYQLSDAISNVYEIYVQFINQLYFKEVTEEEEGARIYEELSKIFKIELELEQLNFEIDEVYEYTTLVERTSSNMKVQLLTITGAALVIPSFVTGFFGMNIFKDEAIHWWKYKEVISWLNSYVLLPIVLVIIICTWTKRKEIRYVILKVLLLGILIYSLFMTIKYGYTL